MAVIVAVIARCTAAEPVGFGSGTWRDGASERGRHPSRPALSPQDDVVVVLRVIVSPTLSPSYRFTSAGTVTVVSLPSGVLSVSIRVLFSIDSTVAVTVCESPEGS
jgi:hypothetical protein